MGYRIQYAPVYRKEVIRKKRNFKIPVLFLALMIALAGITHALPKKTASVIHSFFPLTRAESLAAIDVFCDSLTGGETLTDSITAFCREIIDEAAAD